MTPFVNSVTHLLYFGWEEEIVFTAGSPDLEFQCAVCKHQTGLLSGALRTAAAAVSDVAALLLTTDDALHPKLLQAGWNVQQTGDKLSCSETSIWL
jgi:protein tyrosine/serine phosphatase